MTLAQLETFIAVARAHGFSRAATLLDLAQPTLSGRIAALESELGARLFLRHGHALELTDAGRALLPYAERMLALSAEGRRETQRVARGGLGRLTLGVNPTCGQYVAPRLIEAYARAHPHESVWVRVERSPALMESLLDGAVQLALCSQAQMDPRAEILWRYSDPLLLVAGREHPLGRAGVCERADLTHHTIISTRAGPTRFGLSKLLPAGVEPRIEATAGEVVRQLLLRGLGVSALPAIAIWDELKRGDLVSVRVRDAELPTYDIALAQWPGRELSPASLALVELARATPLPALLDG
ncbi:MAG TPA: LysR family transcriptional regulator [Ktedonobacterales bacterium]